MQHLYMNRFKTLAGMCLPKFFLGAFLAIVSFLVLNERTVGL